MNSVLAQQTDTLAIPEQRVPDTLIILDSNVVKRGWLSKDYPNPKKAALLSLIVPGVGQVYNKGLWYVKVPIIYGAIGGVAYAIDFNQTNYRRFKKAYIQKLNDEDTEFKGLPFDNERSLKILRDYYDKNTQLSYIGLVAVYALQSVEAFVNAHLKTFDVNDDISLRVKPQWNTDLLTGAPTPAIGLVIQFE
ncbi:MAG: hypothetical protein IPJ74_05935 [Saprospiraceae bacterium]|nr:hypothetical protein [Saprospiraceae bacterium]